MNLIVADRMVDLSPPNATGKRFSSASSLCPSSHSITNPRPPQTQVVLEGESHVAG